MATAYWLAAIGLAVVLAGAAVRLLWIPPARGEHSRYDPEFSVSAVATRVLVESVRRGSRDQSQRPRGGVG